MTLRRMFEPGCGCNVCASMPLDQDMTDKQFEEWIKAHPMDPVEQEGIEAAVQRLKKRLRAKPGPELNL